MNTRMKKYVVMAIAVLAMAGSQAWAASTGFEDGTITVTPRVAISLTLAPTTYAFGELDVNTSSVSAVGMLLTNEGDVATRITKQIPSNPGLWVADTSSATANHYILSVATSSVRPNVDESQFSDTGTVHRFGTAVSAGGSDTALRGLGGGAGNVDLDADGGAAPSALLWYRLQMPTAVTSTTGQEIVIRFTGTAL
jgi:hypothetical protein